MAGTTSRRTFVGDQTPCRRCGTPVLVTVERARRSDYWCGECMSLARADWARRNRERKRETNAKWWANATSAQRKEYRDAWKDRNPEKRAAHVAVQRALRNGWLTRQPCEVCGEAFSCAHHDDYSKPLEVRWLCHAHHQEHHHKLKGHG